MWFYFALNFAFFRFPWPWKPWTSRTPSAIIFIVYALAKRCRDLVGGNKGVLGRAEQTTRRVT